MNLKTRIKFISTPVVVAATILLANTGNVLADGIPPNNGKNSPSPQSMSGNLDFQTKCQVLVDAMAKHDQAVINQAASVMAGYTVLIDGGHIASKLTEEDAQSFFQTSFNNCLAHPEATMASQSKAAFDSLQKRVNSRQ